MPYFLVLLRYDIIRDLLPQFNVYYSTHQYTHGEMKSICELPICRIPKWLHVHFKTVVSNSTRALYGRTYCIQLYTAYSARVFSVSKQNLTDGFSYRRCNGSPSDFACPCYPILPDAGARCIKVTRSAAVCQKRGYPKPREQINVNTAFIDASQVYGSTKALAEKLRQKKPGTGTLIELVSSPTWRTFLIILEMRNYVISSLYPIQILVIQLRFTQRFINVLLAKLNTMNYEFAWLLRIAKE